MFQNQKERQIQFRCQEETHYLEGNETLVQAAHRSCGCPMSEGARGQVGWGPGQPDLVPDLVGDDPSCGGSWNQTTSEEPSNPGHSMFL